VPLARKDNFEDSKGVTTSGKSKVKQYNGQAKRDKKTMFHYTEN